MANFQSTIPLTVHYFEYTYDTLLFDIYTVDKYFGDGTVHEVQLLQEVLEKDFNLPSILLIN